MMTLFKLARVIDGSDQQTLDNLLTDAAKNNGLAATRLLLERGADPNQSDAWELCCVKGYSSILELLIFYGLNLKIVGQHAMLASVDAGRSDCIRVLSKMGVSAVFHDDEPLARSVARGYINPTRTLLALGADPNGRQGEIFASACARGSFALIHTLVCSGADTCDLDARPLRMAVRRRNVSLVTFLVNNGADLTPSLFSDADTVSQSFLKDVLNRTRKRRLRSAISHSFNRQEFNWQQLAVPASLTVTGLARLRRQALLLGVNPEQKTKREICRDLALRCYPTFGERPPSDATDLSGTSLSELPPWQLLFVGNKWYNVFDLFKLMDLGKLFDPFTFNELPASVVTEKRSLLAKVLTPSRYKELDILDAVKSNPVPCLRSILRAVLLRDVWEKLPYPPSMDVVMDADDQQVDGMVTKLSLLTSGSRLYRMVSPRALSKIRLQSGTEKLSAFIDLLSDVVKVDDEMSSTRAQLLSIVLRNTTDSAGVEEDLFAFITDDEESIFRFDDDELF